MDNKFEIQKTKKLWRRGKSLAILTLMVSIIKGGFYQIKYGLHWESITDTEKGLGALIDLVFMIVMIIFIIVVADVVDYYLKEK